MYKRRRKKKERNTSLVLFFLSINLFLLYVLLGPNNLLRSSLIGISFSLVLNLFNRIQRRKEKKEKSLSLNIVKLIGKYLHVNRTYILASIFGLVLATFIISQSVLIASSYEQDIFDKHFQSADRTTLRINFKGIASEEDAKTWQETAPTLSQITAKYGFDFQSLTTEDYLKLHISTYRVFHQMDGSLFLRNFEVTTQIWDKETFDILYQFPTFDKNLVFSQNHRILLAPSNATLDVWGESIFGENNEAQIISDSFRKPHGDYSGFTTFGLKMHRIWRPSRIDLEYASENNLDDDLNFLGGHIFCNETEKWNIYRRYMENKPETFIDNDLLHAETRIHTNLPSLNDMNIASYKSNLIKMQIETQTWGYALIETNRVDVTSPLFDSILDFQLKSESLRTRLVIISGPLAGLALFLVYFSLTLVERRKVRLIGIMKLRGTSKEQLQAMFYAEVIVAAIVAVFIGMLLSIPWTRLTLQTSGFLQFGGDYIPLSIPSDWYWRLPIVGLILALDINILSSHALSRMQIEETEEEGEKNRPFWQKIYLDLIFFSISIAFWLFMHFATFSNSNTHHILISIVAPVMILVFFLSSTLIIARYFVVFVTLLSNLLWRFHGGFFSLASRNMKKNKFTASRLASFLLMGMMLSLIAINVSSTYIEFEKSNARYRVGADILIEGIGIEDLEQDNLLEKEGIEAYTEVVSSKMFYYHTGRIRKLYMLGIDPATFSDAAYWDPKFAGQDLDSMMAEFSDDIDKGLQSNNSIEEITEDYTQFLTIGIQSSVMKSLNLDVGDEYKISLSAYRSELTIKFNVVSSFKYFPRLVFKLPSTDEYGYSVYDQTPILGDIRIVKSLAKYTGEVDSAVYIRTSKNSNITGITHSLRTAYENNPDVTITSIDEVESEIFNSDNAKVFIFSLQGMLLVTFVATVIAISYFSFISLTERKNEIGIFRAIGMVKKQIVRLLVTEGLIILALALVFGVLAGIFLSYNIFLVLIGNDLNSTVPPFSTIIPWRTIGLFFVTITSLSIISAVIPALYIASKQTGSILRVE
ncbi:MAG: FtsX-like permease family protein [Candidatus Kariarchaeaceae archaeon]|jgi:ABC-type antimicrobial peptide transport system permease subunit